MSWAAWWPVSQEERFPKGPAALRNPPSFALSGRSYILFVVMFCVGLFTTVIIGSTMDARVINQEFRPEQPSSA